MSVGLSEVLSEITFAFSVKMKLENIIAIERIQGFLADLLGWNQNIVIVLAEVPMAVVYNQGIFLQAGRAVPWVCLLVLKTCGFFQVQSVL